MTTNESGGDREAAHGCQVGRISARGRLALPSFGDGECYVTSWRDGAVRVYPLALLMELEARLATLVSPSARNLRDRLDYYGAVLTVKRQSLTLPVLARSALGEGRSVVITQLPDGSVDVSSLRLIGSLVRGGAVAGSHS